MILVALLEFVFYMALGSVFASQIFIPLYRGTILFPFFRREAVLRHALMQEKQRTEEAKLESEIEKEKQGRRI